MKITYVAHASLLLETQDATVITDPWFNGPAYYNQWHVFPKPVDTSFTGKATHVVLTHGHEDHFHPPTLSLINKKAQVYFPYVWKSGAVERLRSIGFSDVKESMSFETITLGKDFTVTYVANGLDAFTVYQYKNTTILNLNDSLNASHKSFLGLFGDIILKHWPNITYMICGLGGAGYFPNTVHSPLKNDREIGLLREQFSAHKFCEMVNILKPEFVIPFVPGFALLEKDKQWINEIKFSRDNLDAYYREHFDKNSKIIFYGMLPGDSVRENTLIKSSSYHFHVKDDNLSHLLYDQYATEIEECNSIKFQLADTVNKLAEGLNNILPVSTSGIDSALLKKINFGITFHDVQEPVHIHCFYHHGRLVAKTITDWPADINLKISTHTHKLQYAIAEEWGGDVFFIGYGADIDILDQNCLKDNLDIVSLRLLSRFPSASYNMVREPLRAMKYLANNPAYAALAIRQKLATGGNPNKLPYNERSHWINKSKCDVCRLCDIPLLSDEFGEELARSGVALA